MIEKTRIADLNETVPRSTFMDRALACARFQLVFSALFFPSYLGAQALVRAIGAHRQIWLDAELAIPFVPWAILPYLSIGSVFLLPVCCMAPREFDVLERQSILAIAIAFPIFVGLASTNGFERIVPDGVLAPIYRMLFAVDGPSNMAPSLHVTFATLILIACAERLSTPAAAACSAWLAAISVSTLLTHQHHIVDVVSGLALAWTVRRLAPFSTVVVDRPIQPVRLRKSPRE